jgi:quercetin dioxygenase-like cupin family protein
MGLNRKLLAASRRQWTVVAVAAIACAVVLVGAAAEPGTLHYERPQTAVCGFVKLAGECNLRSRQRQSVSAWVARGRSVKVVPTLQEAPMHNSDTGERVTPVLDFPSRDGLAVQAVRVTYKPGGFSRVHRHPAGAYVYVIDGSVMFGLGGSEPVLLKAGDSFYEPPGALHSVSRNASQDLPASFIAFFVLGEGEDPTVDDHD